MGKSRRDENYLWLDHLFASIFNLAYLNLSPFKMRLDEKQGSYCIHSGTWRKYICLVQTLITVAVMIISISSGAAGVSIRNPSMIFWLATEVGDAFLCFMLLYVLWFRQDDITRYFSLLSLRRSEKWGKGHPIHKDDEFHRKGKTMALIISTLAILIVGAGNVLQTFAQLQSMLDASGLGMDSVFGFVFSYLSRGLFIKQPILNVDEMSIYQILGAIAFSTNYYFYKALNAFAIVLCLGGVVVVFHKMWEFANFLQKETNDLAFMRRLQVFKEEVESVNQVIGPIMFGIAVVAGPPFFVANFSRMVTSWDVETLFIGLTWVLYSGILMGAAEISYRTDDICEWILTRGKGDHEDELFGIFVELSQSPIGLRGMECLTVTYRYMAQMVSAVVTFVIILLQFTSAPGGDRWVLDV